MAQAPVRKGGRVITTRNATDMQTREMNTRMLAIRAESIDEKTRSVEAVLTTETPAEIMDWREWREVTEILVADGARFGPQIPLLDNHQRFEIDNQLGSVRNIRKEKGRLVGRLYFAENVENAETAWQLVRQGHADAVSIGYRVDDNGYVDIAPGATAEIKGRTYTAPDDSVLRVSFAWELKELSVVHIGADPNARIREARRAGTTRNKEHHMDPFRKYLESIGLKSDATDAEAMTFYRALTGDSARKAKELFDGLDEAKRSALDGKRMDGDHPMEDEDEEKADESEADKEKAEDKKPEDEEKADKRPAAKRSKRAAKTVDPAEVARAERARIKQIMSLDEGRSERIAEIVKRGVDETWTYEQTAAAVLEAERSTMAAPVSAAPAAHVRSSDPVPDAMAASVLMRGGFRWDQLPVSRALQGDARRAAQAQLADQTHRYRHYGLIDIVYDCLGARGGRHLSPLDAVRELIGMEKAREVGHYMQRGSTGTFSGIFSNVFDVQLMANYEAYPDTTKGWCVERDVQNFQTVDRVLGGKGGALKKLGRGGTAQHDTMGDAKESYKIARYAKQFQLDDQDIIDDRVDLLTDYPREAAEAAAQLRPDGVYYILLANPALDADSVAIFHATSHGANLGTGALNITNLAAGRAIMAKQTQDGRTLNLAPRYLLVPQDLWGTAMQLLNSTEIRSNIAGTSGGIGGDYGTANYIRDLNLQLRVDNRIGVAGVTDPVTGTVQAGEADIWFLVGDRNTIEVGYLRGTGRAPQVRSGVLDQGKFGLYWDVKMDIGFKALDYRAMYKSNPS